MRVSFKRIDRKARNTAAGFLRHYGALERAFSIRDSVSDRLTTVRRAPLERRRRQVLRRDTSLLLVRDEGRWQLARKADHLVAREVGLGHLRLVAAALEASSVPYFLVPAEDAVGSRIGIDRAHQPRALAALEALQDPTLGLWLHDPSIGERHRLITFADGLGARARARALRADVWCVYRNHADPGGHVVLGRPYGCAVEFWRRAANAHPGPAELQAPRWNKKADAVPVDAVGSASVDVDDRAYPTVPQLRRARYFDEVAFPVDLVYTWVDGSDPVWVDRKNEVLRSLDLETVSPDSADDSRYQSRDELKYSLRSVWMYADFVRYIYIVTDDQVPPWLDADHPQIRMASHKQIFGGAGTLPTFNSHAIEARLHHIDGLAEHYLYLNDDFFFCRRVRPETFFLANGLSKFFLSSALMGNSAASAGRRSVDAAAHNSRRLLEQQFSRTTSQKFKHAPYPQRRSVLFEMEEVFADEFTRTLSNQVRAPDDIPVPSSLYHYYAYLTGRAVPGSIAARYVALGQPDFRRRLRGVERAHRTDTLCINDTAPDQLVDVVETERTLQGFLDRNWPVQSPFER